MVLRRLEGEITQKEWIFLAGFVHHEYTQRKRERESSQQKAFRPVISTTIYSSLCEMDCRLIMFLRASPPKWLWLRTSLILLKQHTLFCPLLLFHSLFLLCFFSCYYFHCGVDTNKRTNDVRIWLSPMLLLLPWNSSFSDRSKTLIIVKSWTGKKYILYCFFLKWIYIILLKEN